MSVVRDDLFFSSEGLDRLQKALRQSTSARLWMDPASNSLRLSYLDDGEDEDEFLYSAHPDPS
jgi:hypothetical protein